MNLSGFVDRAKRSGFHLWVFNLALARMIPFNKPHGFTITEIGDDYVKTRIPFRRKNFNHIRGLHACALATISEFTTGLLLITKLDARQYRLIMQRMEMDYHYQGKMDATAEFSISREWMEENIYTPLRGQDAVVVGCEVKIHDRAGNHLTTGKIFWQIKDWQRVKTKA